MSFYQTSARDGLEIDDLFCMAVRFSVLIWCAYVHLWNQTHKNYCSSWCLSQKRKLSTTYQTKLTDFCLLFKVDFVVSLCTSMLFAPALIFVPIKHWI